MVNIRKWDGSFEPFDRGKVIRTCHRLKLSNYDAESVVDEIEKNLFEGIDSRRIIEMIFEFGKKHRSRLGHMIDLRAAIAMMRPKPDFEQFVAILLEFDGYKTVTNQIVMGKCVDHEIDVIATKGDDTIYVEVKHHTQYHTFTGMDTFLQVNSTFEDLKEGYLAGNHKFNFKRCLVVLNTRISEHARRYAECRGIGAMGWGVPEHAGIETHIHDKELYPVTIFKGVEPHIFSKLGDNGVFTIKQIVEADQRDLCRKTGINPDTVRYMSERSKEIMEQ